MAIVFDRTPPLFKPGDGRLKILWIEDKQDDLIPYDLRSYTPWFSLISVSYPRDVLDLLNLEEQSDTGGKSPDSLLYDSSTLPADVYLTDFCLYDKKYEGEVSYDPVQAQMGLYAPSAGFLVGLLTALRFPLHPQAIIPYSGFEEEFGHIWNLCRQFCPPSLHVLWDESITKGNRNAAELLGQVTVQYRHALIKVIENGIVHIPMLVRSSWETRLDGEVSMLSGLEQISFVSEYGLRPFLLGSLFYDHLDSETQQIPASEVKHWLSQIPVATPMVRSARGLTAFYWALRHSPLSCSVYNAIQQRSLDALLSSNIRDESPPSFPWLLGGFKKGTDKESILLMRLTVLFLMIQEHAMRIRIRRSRVLTHEEQHFLSFIQFLPSTVGKDDVKMSAHALHDILEQSPLFKRKEKLHKLIEDIARSGSMGNIPLFQGHAGIAEDDLVNETDSEEPLEISEIDIVRLVNPLPSSWDSPTTLTRLKFIGKGLSRLKYEEYSFDVKSLLRGDGSKISPFERRAAIEYALELMPMSRDWPLWLRKIK